MYTFQDLSKIDPKDEKKRIDFVFSAIQQHKDTDLYQTALLADEYDRQRNRTILEYQKTLVTLSGKIVQDRWSPNHKTTCGFFPYFLTQQVQYLLDNGVNWNGTKINVPEGTPGAIPELVWDRYPAPNNENDEGESHYEYKLIVDLGTSDKLGKDFDQRLEKVARMALSGGVAFGFWNYDHMDVFSVLEFVPLYDEDNGAMMAGIRFWQVADNKPLRATLYEVDGYTDYEWNKNDEGKYMGAVLHERQAYKTVRKRTKAEGDIIYDGLNYDTFPIVPCWGNPHRQSEIVGIQEQIDAYDLVKNGFLNDADTAVLYWIIQGAGGMDNSELTKFMERIKMTHTASLDDGQSVEPVTVEIPYNAREVLLDRLKNDIYRDYGALDVDKLSGAATATEIKAAYEPMNIKSGQFETCIHEFLHGILAIVGIDDEPSFTRSVLVNENEMIQTVISAADFTGDEYTTRKVLTILGDGDQADLILTQKDADEMDRFGMDEGEEETDDEELPEEDAGVDIDDELGGDESALDDLDKEIENLLKDLGA